MTTSLVSNGVLKRKSPSGNVLILHCTSIDAYSSMFLVFERRGVNKHNLLIIF